MANTQDKWVFARSVIVCCRRVLTSDGSEGSLVVLFVILLTSDLLCGREAVQGIDLEPQKANDAYGPYRPSLLHSVGGIVSCSPTLMRSIPFARGTVNGLCQP